MSPYPEIEGKPLMKQRPCGDRGSETVFAARAASCCCAPLLDIGG
jgi:hypothetical protein